MVHSSFEPVLRKLCIDKLLKQLQHNGQYTGNLPSQGAHVFNSR